MNELIPRPVGYSKEAVLYGMPMDKLLWIDYQQAGKMLDPEAKDPVKLAQKIYERNKAQFTERDTVLLDVDMEHIRVDLRGQFVPADGQEQADLKRQNDAADTHKTPLVKQKRKVRFFSIPYGFNKLNLFSNSPHKAQIADWIQDIHVSYLKGTLPRWDKGIAGIAAMPRFTRGRGKAIAELAQASGVCHMTIRRRADRMRKGEPITRNCPGMKKGYCHKKHTDSKETALQHMAEGKSVREIDGIVKVPLATLYRWRKEVII